MTRLLLSSALALAMAGSAQAQVGFPHVWDSVRDAGALESPGTRGQALPLPQDEQLRITQRDLSEDLRRDLGRAQRAGLVRGGERSEHVALSRATMSEDGLSLHHPKGTVLTYAPTRDMPPISWPVGAVFDNANKRLYGVTLGGEGYVYGADRERAQTWIVGSMKGVDAFAIGHDSTTDQLILGEYTNSGNIQLWQMPLPTGNLSQMGNPIATNGILGPVRDPRARWTIIGVRPQGLLLARHGEPGQRALVSRVFFLDPGKGIVAEVEIDR